jgi:Tfp pilus assembly protein PilF
MISLLEQALVSHQHGKLSQAMDLYQKVLAINPLQANVLNNVGILLQGLMRDEDALAYFDRALALEPDFPPVLYNRGNTLRRLNRPLEAVQCYDQVLRSVPNNPEILNNRGNALRALNRLDDAYTSYQLAIRYASDYADAHWNASLCALLAGNYQQGWQQYEWRWASELKTEKRSFAQPQWDGAASLQGKIILLHAEQGYGDTLQFCRYANLVKALGATVILETQPQLVKVLAELKGVDVLVARGDLLPKFDYHCPLLSLPNILATDLDSIPAALAYLMSNTKRTSVWQARLGVRSKLRVGLVWAGSLSHKNDHNRSIPLESLKAIFAQDANFYSLQKELRDGDKKLIQQHPQLDPLGKYIKDFTDTAALISLMDVVITVDTAVAHLAGAMGKPVWVLLPYSPDWRWMLNREDSPWYPTARLFRQLSIGDWSAVVADVNKALLALQS